MKPFYYITENNDEQLDLIALFEHAFDYKIDSGSISDAIKEIEKHAEIKAK